MGTRVADARARPGVTAEQQAQFDDQRLRLSLRTAGRQIDAGDLAGAERTLDAVPASGKKDKRWLLAQADLREAQRDYRGAEASAREVLVDHPGDADARLTIARMEERMGHRQAAQDIIDQVLADTPPDDVDTRLAIARRYTAIGKRGMWSIRCVSSIRTVPTSPCRPVAWRNRRGITTMPRSSTAAR